MLSFIPGGRLRNLAIDIPPLLPLCKSQNLAVKTTPKNFKSPMSPKRQPKATL